MTNALTILLSTFLHSVHYLFLSVEVSTVGAAKKLCRVYVEYILLTLRSRSSINTYVNNNEETLHYTGIDRLQKKVRVTNVVVASERTKTMSQTLKTC